MEVENDKKGLFTVANIIRVIIVMIVIAGAICGIVLIKDIQNILEDFTDWVDKNYYLGTLCFILIFSLAIVIMFPAVLFSITVGYVYTKILKSPAKGFFMGFFVAYTSTIIGAMIA